jgi:alkylation response protein AidB-like acyl-CoA dehydrogenase
MPIDFELSEEHRMIKETVSGLLKRFEPRAEEFRRMIHNEKKFPQEVWDAIAETGLLGSLIPEEYGGSGMGLMALTLAVEQMAAHGFGHALIILTGMDALCILRNGSDALKKKFLPDIAQGKTKFCFALTEPDAGSNTFRIATVARRNSHGYRISGQKVFITGADIADYMLLVARTTTPEELKQQNLPKVYGLSLFIVPTKTKGLTMTPIPTRGIEGMTQYTLYFDDVEVPAENLVGEENLGSMALFNSLNPERILAAATACGITENLLRKAVSYAKDRTVFKNAPIGSYQAIQHPLAEVRIELEAARLLTYKSAWAFDKGLDPAEVGTYANMAKLMAADLALKACDRAIETLGGYGFSEEYGVIYYWDAVRLIKTAPITREMILNYIAEHVLELPRSY